MGRSLIVRRKAMLNLVENACNISYLVLLRKKSPTAVLMGVHGSVVDVLEGALESSHSRASLMALIRLRLFCTG